MLMIKIDRFIVGSGTLHRKVEVQLGVGLHCILHETGISQDDRIHSKELRSCSSMVTGPIAELTIDEYLCPGLPFDKLRKLDSPSLQAFRYLDLYCPILFLPYEIDHPFDIDFE